MLSLSFFLYFSLARSLALSLLSLLYLLSLFLSPFLSLAVSRARSLYRWFLEREECWQWSEKVTWWHYVSLTSSAHICGGHPLEGASFGTRLNGGKHGPAIVLVVAQNR